jgi:hypothetical protein
MNDSDWRDPFADDDAARDRDARRAERAARRRERAQQQLGERVRETERTADSGSPTADSGQRTADSKRPASPPPQRSAAKTPPPPPTSEQAKHRRTVALLVLGAVIVLVAAVGVVLSRSGEGDTAPAAPKERKTQEVVIPEGYDRAQIAQVAKKAGIKGNYEKASVSSRAINLKEYGAQDAESLEGFLFPATYEIFRGDDVDALIDRQLEAFEANIAEIDLTWAERNGYSVYDVVNVASMVEREIQVPEERKLAASVIYNRLDAGNPLGIDATIRFEDQNYTEPLVESRLNEPTPYNTRINPGLPPGPIGNPGRASLEAAANPAETDYFYFVIKPGTCNEHTFVETEEEFAAAEAEYQAALQAEGGSPTKC